jgi:hypothetical protein
MFREHDGAEYGADFVAATKLESVETDTVDIHAR